MHIPLLEDRARHDVVEARVGEEHASLTWIGDLRFHGDEIAVTLPSLGEVLLAGTGSGEVRARLLVREQDAQTIVDPHDDLRVAWHGESLVAAERSLLNNSGDAFVRLHLFGGAGAPRRSFEQRDEYELHWALGRDGAFLVTAEADQERARLVATVYGAPSGEKIRSFTVGGEDEYDCDAIAIDDGGARAAFVTEAGVLLFDLSKKQKRLVATWESPAESVAALCFATRRGTLFAIEDGRHGAVWMLRSKGASPPILGAKLLAEERCRFLGISPDEEFSYWVARPVGSAAWSLFRVNLGDGCSEIASVDFGVDKLPPVVAVDEGCARYALALADGVHIEEIPAAWRRAGEQEMASITRAPSRVEATQ
jgi:hypothetical protein